MAEDKSSTPGDFVSSLERFFLDLIGSVVPGGLFLIGWVLLFDIPLEPGRLPAILEPLQIWALLALAYVVGHLITSIGQYVFPLWELLRRRIPRSSESNDSATLTEMPIYVSFVQSARERWPNLATISAVNFHDWRNVAMSLLTPEQNHTIYRFMFISLMSLGVGTVAMLLILAWFVAQMSMGLAFVQTWGTSLFPRLPDLDFSVLIGAVAVFYFFFERRSEFYLRALRTPFSMAIMRLHTDDRPKTVLASPERARERPVVYLAGGMRSNWQESVIEQLGDWTVIDPRTHHLSEENQYTYWDLQGVRKSDWVLAYFEASNPGGFNLAVEIGYAKALGRGIVLVDERSAADPSVKRYTGMLRGCADISATTLEEAICFLKKTSTLNQL